MKLLLTTLAALLLAALFAPAAPPASGLPRATLTPAPPTAAPTPIPSPVGGWPDLELEIGPYPAPEADKALTEGAIGVRWVWPDAGALITFAGPGCLALDGGWGGQRPLPEACASGPGWYDVPAPGGWVPDPHPGDAYLLLRGGTVVGRAALPDRHSVALPLIWR